MLETWILSLYSDWDLTAFILWGLGMCTMNKFPRGLGKTNEIGKNCVGKVLNTQITIRYHH